MRLFRCAPVALAVVALLPAGCVRDAELYPSLAIREEERVSGVFDPVPARPWIPPAPDSKTLDELAHYRAEATLAHQRVLAAAEAARAPLAAARGSQAGGEEWAVAAAALADVEARRGETVAALAGIDRIHVAAQTEAGEVGAIEPVVNEVAAMVAEEDRLIAELRAQLPE